MRGATGNGRPYRDIFAPLAIDERRAPTGPCVSEQPGRCSDKGFLPMPLTDYLQLLDWTAREVVSGKRGATPATVRPILERLSLTPQTWTTLVQRFGRLFIHVAGRPPTIDTYRSQSGARRFNVRGKTRQLLSSAA